MKRRHFLETSAWLGVGATLTAAMAGGVSGPRSSRRGAAFPERSVAALQDGMTRGEFTSADLVRGYRRRGQLLDQAGCDIGEWIRVDTRDGTYKERVKK